MIENSFSLCRSSRIFHIFITHNFSRGTLFDALCDKIRFNEETAKFYAASLVIALNNFHNQGIVYRDLKPENILIKSNGYIGLTDMGMQRIMHLKKKSKKGPLTVFYGTTEYLAPETVIGKE